MGITKRNLDWMTGLLPGGPLRMLELGNQLIHDGVYPPRSAKPYFTALGFDHTSVDLNGLDGALPYDLCAPFLFDRGFDVATDFGTSEHVSNLWQCLENLHSNVNPGGLLFHSNPEPGSWPEHGFWYRTRDFYEAFAKLAGYEIVDLHRHAAVGNTTDGWETTCCMRRGTKAFPTKEAFTEVPLAKK